MVIVIIVVIIYSEMKLLRVWVLRKWYFMKIGNGKERIVILVIGDKIFFISFFNE